MNPITDSDLYCPLCKIEHAPWVNCPIERAQEYERLKSDLDYWHTRSCLIQDELTRLKNEFVKLKMKIEDFINEVI